MAFFAQDLRAQNRTVSGAVTGSDGASIPGVTVIVKGGTQGTSTDVDGKYSLSVPQEAKTLVFSFVGYASQEAAIGSGSNINVTLKADATGLDEVVVVGYGTQSRRDLTGNVATVSGKEIKSLPVQSFDQALQGRASGVNITTPNGVLNAPPVIRIRGVNSISLSGAPLFVVDGIPTYSGNNSAVANVPNNPLANINPEDIESIEVLKDASAAAIYGSRAIGGVILITTKRGRKGQAPRLSVDNWVGVTQPVRLIEVLNAQDYVTIKNEAVRNLNENRRLATITPTNPNGTPGTNVEGFKIGQDGNGNNIDTDWYDYVYRTGVSSNHNLNFSGGTDRTTYFTSVNYTKQRGMLKNNEFQRYGARLNVDHKLFDRVTVGTNVSYSNNRNDSPNSGSVGDGAFGTGGLGRLPLVLQPNVSPFNPDGTPNTSGAGLGAGPNLNPTTNAPLVGNFYNPVVELANNYYTSESNQIQGSVFANVELLKGLNLRTQYGIDNITFEDRSFLSPLGGDGFAPQGSASNFLRTNKRWNWQNTLQYDHTFAEKHNLSVLLGQEQQQTDVLRSGYNRSQIADPFFTSIQGNFTNIVPTGELQGANYLVSFFSRVNYNYARKYLLTLTARRDGYSAFTPDNRFENFYGASAGYVISEEDFWKNSALASKVDFLKLVGSYGEVGNFQGIDDFATKQLYSSGLYGSNPTLYYSLAGNPDLKWEVARKSDVGLAFGLFGSRLTGDVTYYRNLIDDLIVNAPAAPSIGLPNPLGPGNLQLSIPANVGSMVNKGIELNLRFNAIQKTNFTWTVSGNFSTLKNEVLELATADQRIATATSGLETVNFTTVGRSIGSILAVPTPGVNPVNGQRLVQRADGSLIQYNHQGTSGAGSTGWTLVSTGANVPAPSQLADGVYFGPVLPTWYGGFDNTFTYRGFDLGVFVQFSGGNYIYNGTKSGLHDQRFWNNATDILERWTSESSGNAKYPRVVYTDNVSNGSALVLSSNVEKGDFARLRNLSLGYTFTSGLLSKAKMNSARVYVQAQNLVLLTNYSGVDPEVSTNGASNSGAGVDRNSIGQARTFTAGLSLGF
ncbi:SusC/RagA family TonB-linked outer membrane protein [Hymenobacter jeongseonensis]|uniref:SusC/RagA family TonB-linked outer membrane protein n=1 Tax=Hymenobacter jeongseonensis TaxID=2791027 RepID=UPI001E373D67|nr:TonB-dependent receptor [Hymenobacter jeongseonensis]